MGCLQVLTPGSMHNLCAVYPNFVHWRTKTCLARRESPSVFWGPKPGEVVTCYLTFECPAARTPLMSVFRSGLVVEVPDASFWY